MYFQLPGAALGPIPMVPAPHEAEIQQQSQLPEPLRDLFRQRGITVLLEKRDRLLREGESLHGVYLLESGRMRVWMRGRDNRRAFTRMVGSGHLLGLPANFGQQASSLNVTAMTRSQLGFISRECLLDFMRAEPEVALWIVRYLGIEVRQMTLKLGR